MIKLSMRNIGAALGVAVVCTAGAQEEKGIKLGAMQFHPFVAGDITYDSNVFQTSDVQADVYEELAVGARLNRDTDSFHFDSSAWFSRRFYNEYDSKDGNRWGLAGLLRGESDKTFGLLLFDARQVDDYNQAPVFGSVPSGFEGTVDVAFDRTTGNEPRRIYDFLAGGGYLLGDKVSIMGGYKFYAVDYYEGSTNLESWVENTLGLEISGKFSDKVNLFVNGQFGAQNGPGSPYGEKAEVVTLRFGAKNNLTDKSTLRIGLGATYYANFVEEFTEPSFELSGLWSATDKITLFIDGRNQVQPVGDGVDVQMSARGSTGINYVLNNMINMVLSGSVVYDRYLDETLLSDGSYGAPEGTTLIGTYRINVTPIKRLEVFGQIEATDAQKEISDDYSRLRIAVGLGYAF